MGRIYGVFIVAAILIVVTLLMALGYQLTVNAKLKNDLQAALTNNKLLSQALDKLAHQRRIDDQAVQSLNRKLADVEAAYDRQAEALRKLADDPVTAEYLNRRVPDSVRCLFEHEGC